MSVRRIGRRFGTGVGILAATASLACEPVQTVHAYIERLGTDTTAVEMVVDSPDGVEGWLVARMPATRVAHYRGTRGADGRIVDFSVDWSTPAENPSGTPPTRSVTRFHGDSATTIRYQDGAADTTSAPAGPSTIPAISRIPFTIGVLQEAIALAPKGGREGDGYRVGLLYPGATEAWENSIGRPSPGTFTFDFFGSPFVIRVDGTGRITHVSGPETTLKIEVERTDPIDVEALAARFAARDHVGDSLGVLSPLAEVTARLGSATLEIQYSRPSRRGRELYGSLIPWAEVWRTGANAATHLTTDVDIRLGRELLPAGRYTLWSTFTPDSATLIVNAQTDQWGTQYDSRHDVIRVPLSLQLASPAVETFTISVHGEGEEGRLLLEWGERRFGVSVAVAR